MCLHQIVFPSFEEGIGHQAFLWSRDRAVGVWTVSARMCCSGVVSEWCVTVICSCIVLGLSCCHLQKRNAAFGAQRRRKLCVTPVVVCHTLSSINKTCSLVHGLEYILIYVTLEHKNSVESLGYIYSNSQKYIVCQNYRFFFYAKNH